MRTVLHLSLIALAVGVVFSNTLTNGLYFDDRYLVLENPGIRDVHPAWRHFVDPRTISALPRITQFRPVLPLSLSISHFFGGQEGPAAHHVGNILCHLAVCFLIYALSRELVERWAAVPLDARRGKSLALFVALLTAVHPVSGFPVNYISARDLLLMQAFLLGAMLVWIRMRRLGSSAFGWIASLVLMALALLSKTNAAVMPLLVLAFEVTVRRQKILSTRPWVQAVPFAVVVLLHLAWKRLVLGFSELSNAVDLSGSPWTNTLIQARVHVVEYLKNFVWPFAIRLTPRAETQPGMMDPGVLAGFAVIAASLVLAWRLRDRRPAISFCILAYWILLAPSSSVFKLYYEVAHYRPYPSMPFLLLALSVAAYAWLGRRTRSVIAMVLLLFFAGSAYALNRTWSSAERAWWHSIHHGGHAVAHMNYAMSLRDRTDPRVREHLEQAVRLNPNQALAVLNLGLLYIDLGENERGIGLVQQAVRIAPAWGQVRYWLGVAYTRTGRDDLALEPFVEAARLAPGNGEYQFMAAAWLQRAGEYDRSLEFLERIEPSYSDYPEALFLKGLALQKRDSIDEAISAYRQLLLLREDDAQAHFNLAYALMESGLTRDATAHFERTLELQPDYREVHYHLATCFAELGKPAAAELHRRRYESGE